MVPDFSSESKPLASQDVSNPKILGSALPHSSASTETRVSHSFSQPQAGVSSDLRMATSSRVVAESLLSLATPIVFPPRSGASSPTAITPEVPRPVPDTDPSPARPPSSASLSSLSALSAFSPTPAASSEPTGSTSQPTEFIPPRPLSRLKELAYKAQSRGRPCPLDNSTTTSTPIQARVEQPLSSFSSLSFADLSNLMTDIPSASYMYHNTAAFLDFLMLQDKDFKVRHFIHLYPISSAKNRQTSDVPTPAVKRSRGRPPRVTIPDSEIHKRSFPSYSSIGINFT